MASLLPVRTLRLILILLTVLALGAAGLCHLWWGVGRASEAHAGGTVPSRALKEQLVWPVGVRGLVMAVTRHQSLSPGHTPGSLPNLGGRDVWGRAPG